MTRPLPDAARRGWCPGLSRPMPTGDGLLARIHPPLGVLTLAQASAVAEGARRFGNGHLDLTARANLQIRGVRDDTREALATWLDAAGLGDVRHDGGPQRLTLTSPLARGAVADLARAIEVAGRSVPGVPPKTFIAVGMLLDEADFSVLASGENRAMIVPASQAVPAVDGPWSEAPAELASLLAAFVATGKRRMREVEAGEFVVVSREPASHHHLETLTDGSLVFLSPPAGRGPPTPCRVGGKQRRSRRDGEGADRMGLARRPPSPSAAASLRPRQGGLSPLPASGARECSPKPGLSDVAGQSVLALDAPFGRCTAEAFARLVTVAEAIGAPEIRLSATRGVVLLPTHPERVRLVDLAADFIVTADDPRRAVSACTGAPACSSGTTATLIDAVRLAEAFRPLAARGLTAHVSGCAKGCAKPGPADLTLVAKDGTYTTVVDGGPGDPPLLQIPIEAALERLGKAATVGLSAAFAAAAIDEGRNRSPA